MKNLGTLFGYEMKKIWKRPMTWIAVLVFSAGFAWYLPIRFYNSNQTFAAIDPSGEVIAQGEVTREEQIKAQLEGPRALSGRPVDDAFFQEAQGKFQMSDNQSQPDGYFFLIDPSYYDAYHRMAPWMRRGTAEDYYNSRWRMIEEKWREYSHLTGEERAYWERMEARVEKPFVYEPMQGPERLMEVLSLMGQLAPVLVALCVCDIFPQERRTRTEALIFSSRQGRLCLYLAKTLAGGVTAMAVAAFAAGAVMVCSLYLYGHWGWGGSIQLSFSLSDCCLPLTLGQGILILAGLFLMYALLSGALAEAVSMWSGSAVVTLAASAAVAGAQILAFTRMWLSNMEGAQYLPILLVNISPFKNQKLTNLFGVQLNMLQSGALLYLILSVTLFGLCWLGWRRQAVSGV